MHMKISASSIITDRMQYNHMTPEDVAKRCGISRASFFKYKKQPEKMTVEIAKRMSEVLGCSVMYLIEGAELNEGRKK